MIAMVKRLDAANGSEAELDAITYKLMQELPHADVVTLLYHTRPELSAEEAIDEAMRRERAWREQHGVR
jgi:hypothetical protein